MFIGVDGFKKGWVAVAITDAGFLSARAFPDFEDLVEHYPDAAVIGVDMPLRLVDEGDREADQAARGFLTGQASSVFNAPPRPVLDAVDDYAEAQRISRGINGKGISKQSFAIIPKIIQLQSRLEDRRIHEVHPEIGFRILHAGARIPHGKKTWGGLQARLALLRCGGIELPAHIDGANHVGIDDVVDAAVAAWTARRIGHGAARSFPKGGGAAAIWG